MDDIFMCLSFWGCYNSENAIRITSDESEEFFTVKIVNDKKITEKWLRRVRKGETYYNDLTMIETTLLSKNEEKLT